MLGGILDEMRKNESKSQSKARRRGPPSKFLDGESVTLHDMYMHRYIIGDFYA